VALRRQEARTAEGQPTGCYTNTIEIICRTCGDDPGRDITTSRLGCSGVWYMARFAGDAHVRR